MTIHDKQIYMDKLWDWGFLDRCFEPTRIRLTDVDGIVERRGHFLLIEAKSPGKDVPTGQQIMFNHLSAIPNWTILVIWGEAPDQPISCMIWGKEKQIASQDTIRQIVSRWFEEANK